MPGRTLSYDVVLVRCDPHVIASIKELDIQVGGANALEAIEAARRRALRVLATYEEDGCPIPDPVEKMLATIEVPRPSAPLGRSRGRRCLRVVEGVGAGRR
jgi:hypothetical protein